MNNTPPSRVVPVTKEHLEKCKINSKPINTVSNTKGSVNLYNVWRAEKGSAGESVPPLDCCVPYLLSSVIPRFFAEIRKKDGDVYRSSSLKNYYAGLNRYLVDTCNINIYHHIKQGDTCIYQHQNFSSKLNQGCSCIL